MIVLTLATLAMLVLTYLSHWAVSLIGWCIFVGVFAGWYWMLIKSQAMDPRTRGGEPTSCG
jgi:hypothetical protein